LKNRTGTFSSSAIYKLVKSGRSKDQDFSAIGLTYIKEKSYEVRLGQSLGSDQSSKATSWGNVVESYAYASIPNYDLEPTARIASDKRRKHPSLMWTGASDFESDTLVGDIKCPFTRKSFCEQVDIYEEVRNGNIEAFKAAKPEYYWQLVSNCILANKDFAMAVVYCPKEDDVLEILSESNLEYDANHSESLNQAKEKVKWLTLEETPYLKNDCAYSDINSVKFKVPQEDKDFLTERVELAQKELFKLLK
tara:strand:+ start:157 stop:906 length:750 start_codon:yes stop_codon:yes gene_type:complete